MKEVLLNFGHSSFPLEVPDQTAILPMGKALKLPNPEEKIYEALTNPIGCPPLKTLVQQKLRAHPHARAVIVISDNTRPVPYSGKSSILFPLVEGMIQAGLKSSQIRLLVATGTHRAMSEKELRNMLDPRIFELSLKTVQHDCRNTNDLVSLGRTEFGGEIFINRYYMESEIKILTGLVESHFMAGVSGGRKSICPGLLAEDSTYCLHGGSILSSPKATDLILKGNPVHEESLRVARMAGCDMIVNVTLDKQYELTGVFAGHLEKAHLAAVEKLCSYAEIPIRKEYDLVLGHTGFVGVNHYQAAKGALTCLPILKKKGICLLAARHTDPDTIGGPNYKKMMRILGELGVEEFLRTILDPSWSFVPDQWEAQMWAKFFQKIPFENLIYCTFDIPEESFSWLPGTDARTIAPKAKTIQELVETSLDWGIRKFRSNSAREPEIAFLADGPYGIPTRK